MKNLKICTNYINPANSNIEIIERKGIGHPDTLADKLAEECSRVYSNYCIDNFGCVLHHNFDKLYIGAGCFLYENGETIMKQPIKVYINGRASNKMNNQRIDLDNLLKPVVKRYLKSVLPKLDVEKELDININCTQNTKIKNWFTPRNIDDIPDATKIFANDTSLCVAHYPFTICEQLALNIEKSFWDYSENNFPTPKYNDIGQDIKVMVSRVGKKVTLTICIPVYPDKFKNNKEYTDIIKKYEDILILEAKKITGIKKYNLVIEINKMANGDYLFYSLCKGSCIECGEEGVVGRGNNSQGIISSLRSHTMEAPYGKNERYHTGRVLSFLADRTVRRIYDECGVKSSIYCLTKNKNDLFNPFLLYLSINKRKNISKIKKIIDEEFNDKEYLNKILESKKIY